MLLEASRPSRVDRSPGARFEPRRRNPRFGGGLPTRVLTFLLFLLLLLFFFDVADIVPGHQEAHRGRQREPRAAGTGRGLAHPLPSAIDTRVGLSLLISREGGVHVAATRPRVVVCDEV